MNVSQPQTSDQPKYSGREKRAASRLFFNADCVLIFEDGYEMPVGLTNVSFTGAFVNFKHDDKESFINLRVNICFTLIIKNKPHPLKVSGMVVRANENGVGIAFRMSECNRIETIIEDLSEDMALKHLTNHAGTRRNC